MHDEQALGYLADEDGLVSLTIVCVALARAQTYADVGRWEYWRKWQAEADRLEALHNYAGWWKRPLQSEGAALAHMRYSCMFFIRK